MYTKSKSTIATDVIASDISDHFLTLTTYSNSSSKRAKTSITKRWLTFDSYAQLQQLLKAENWDCMEAMLLEESTNYLTSKINEGIDIVCLLYTSPSPRDS